MMQGMLLFCRVFFISVQKNSTYYWGMKFPPAKKKKKRLTGTVSLKSKQSGTFLTYVNREAPISLQGRPNSP